MEFGVRGAGGQSPLWKPRLHATKETKDIEESTFLLDNKDNTIDTDDKIGTEDRGMQPTLDLLFGNTFLHNKHP